MRKFPLKKNYVMAHRCNTKKWLEQAIKWEANGIECDVTKDDDKYYTWHGDVGGWEHLDVYLDYARQQLQSGKGGKVSLFIFDLKYDNKDGIKASDISYIRQKVQQKLLQPINSGFDENGTEGLYAFYGTYEGKYSVEFEQSIERYPLQSLEGINFDADLKTAPEKALEWKEKKQISNFFYSSGIFLGGCSSTMWKQLKRAGELRFDSAFGVYGWTFGEAQSAANSVKEYKLDGVLGNMDQNYGWLPTNLDSYELGSYGLVSRQDEPPFLVKIGYLRGH